MNLTKDTYEYLTNFADDKDIVKMLSVNKQFSDPIFFERIFKRKYPLLIKFKSENETWKNFYLRMVKNIAKLEEQYHIPYIAHPDFNPEIFYGRYTKGLGITHAQEAAVFYAISINDRKNITQILKHVNNKIRYRVLGAAIHGATYNKDVEMVNFLQSL